MDKQSPLLGSQTPLMMPQTSSTSTDANAAASSSRPPSPIQTPISPVSPPSPQKLKKKRSKKNSESEDKPTLTRAISLSTSSMVTPVLNASGPPTAHSKKASSVPKPQTRATPRKESATPAGAAQKPKETTPPIQELPSAFDGLDELAKALAEDDVEPRPKPARQLSYAAVTAKPASPENLLSKPIGTTRGKAPKFEGQVSAPRQQPYTRQPAQQSQQQRVSYRDFTLEERQRWETLRMKIEKDKAHMSWLENDAGNTDTAKLAVLERIIEYRDLYGTMPMEVTFKTTPNAKGGVEKVVCGPCRKEGKTPPKEYPTVQKAAVHITSNHWEMHLWLCTVPNCTKVFRCRDGIQNPKRHMEKAHPQPNNPDPSVYIANPVEPTYLVVPQSSNYAESASGTEYSYNSTYAPSIGSQYVGGSNGGYPSASYPAPHYTSQHEQYPVTQESEAVYVQSSQAKGKGRSAGAPLKLHPPLMPVPPAPLPDQPSSASPSRSQGPVDELFGKLSNFFGLVTSPTHQVQPTGGQNAARSSKVAFGSISPSEMQNVVPAQVPRAPMRRLTADTRPVPATGMTMMMGQTSLNAVPGRARNVSNPTTMYTQAPFQIPAFNPIPMQPMQSYAPPTQPMYQQPPYATSSHATSLSPQQTSPPYAASTGYGQTPESYMSSPPQKMPNTSPYSQGHLHLSYPSYPSPASTGALSASPPYSSTGSHIPLHGANMANPTAYLSPQASGQHSPDQSSRSSLSLSLSSSPFPPTDDPLGYDYSQGGKRTSFGSGSGTGQPIEYGSGAPSLEYVNTSSQAPLSSSSDFAQYTSLSGTLQPGAAPLSDANAYSYAPPPQKTLTASDVPMSDVEFRKLQAYIAQIGTT